jgi:hypothetical protein
MCRLLGGLFLLAGCAGDVTAPATALLVTASVSRESFRVGDTVTVLVTVFNRSGQPQTIGGGGCGFLGFDVTTQDGTVVGPKSAFCSAVLYLKTLTPGEQYSEAQPWTGSALGPATDTPTLWLTPGTYVVIGAVASYRPDGSSETPPATDHVPALIAITP